MAIMFSTATSNESVTALCQIRMDVFQKWVQELCWKAHLNVTEKPKPLALLLCGCMLKELSERMISSLAVISQRRPEDEHKVSRGPLENVHKEKALVCIWDFALFLCFKWTAALYCLCS